MTISEMRGQLTSQTEVSNISANGLWVLCNDREYFLPYDQFPWFKDAPIKYIFNVEESHPGHLYWPDLDVDLSLDIIQHPERFPLISE
jgi:hypothetical protein